MKVLQLAKYYYPYVGGIESHVHLLCNEIKRYVQTEVVACNSAAHTVRDIVDGLSVTRCGEVFNVASTSICPTMANELSHRRCDIIHLHFPHPVGAISYLASAQARAHRLVITYHSDIVRQKILLKLYAPFMHHVMQRAVVIICSSLRYITSSPVLSAYRSKCRVIPYGIDLARFALTRAMQAEAAKIRAQYGEPLLLCVGRLVYYKGFEYAIRALQRIKGNLLLVGDGPLRRRLASVARDCGVFDRVHFLAAVDNSALPAYYHASDLFLLPSIARSEAFGIVQLEAMACGKPVVNTALDSGVPFVSRHRESGLTVQPKSPEALADAVTLLLRSPAWMRQLGEEGRRRVERDFSKEVMSERVIDVYREVSSLPRGSVIPASRFAQTNSLATEG